MEPGLFGIIQRMTGQPDIDQQIAQAMGRAPGQPGGPGPNPLNPPPPGPAGAGNPPAGPAPAAAGPAAAPPTPQAYQTQPDINQLYMQFMRQQQASQMFNQGLAGLTASLSRSPDRSRYLSMGQTQPIDAGETFGNLMKMQQWQMQNQRLAGTQAAVPGMLKGYGITDPAQIAFYQNNPDQLQTLIAAHAPEGIYKNWLNARDDAVRNSGADPNDPQAVAKAHSDFEQKNPLVNALTPAGGDPALNSLHLEANDWQSKHPGETLPDYFDSPASLAAHSAQVQALGATQSAASSSLPSLNGNLLDMRAKAQEIASMDPDKLQEVLSRAPNILSVARNNDWLATKLPAGYDVTQDQLDLLRKIDELGTYNTSGMKQANPHLITSILPIESDLGGLSAQHFGTGAANFQTTAKKVVDDIDTARAQAIGASGQLDKALGNPDFESKIDSSYLPGGRNYLGEAKKMNPAQIAEAKAMIPQFEAQYPGRGVAIVKRKLQLQGFTPDPSLGQ